MLFSVCGKGRFISFLKESHMEDFQVLSSDLSIVSGVLFSETRWTISICHVEPGFVMRKLTGGVTLVL